MKYGYLHLDWRELANRLAREGRMAELFRELMLATNGDVEQALAHLGELAERYHQIAVFQLLSATAQRAKHALAVFNVV